MNNKFETHGLPQNNEQKNQADTAELKRLHKEGRLIEYGATIEAIGLDGQKDGGWKLDRYVLHGNETKAILKKEIEGKSVVIAVPEVELYALNKPTGDTKRFSINQWRKLWNTTEPSFKIKESDLVNDEKTEMLTPENAKARLRELSGRIGRTNEFGLEMAQQESLETYARALERRQMLFGLSRRESKELMAARGAAKGLEKEKGGSTAIPADLKDQRNEGSEETPEEKLANILEQGDEVSVLRLNGAKEKGWLLAKFDKKTGDAIVSKIEGNKVLTKSIPQIELYALNKPEGETKRFPAEAWIKLWNYTEAYSAWEITDADFGEKDREAQWSPEEAGRHLHEIRKKIRKKRRSGQLKDVRERTQKRVAFFGVRPSVKKAFSQIRKVMGIQKKAA